MKWRRAQYLILCLGLLLEWASAVQALTIDGAVDQAFQSSPELKKSVAMAKEAEWKSFEALGSGFLPQVYFDGKYFTHHKFEIMTVDFGGNATSVPGIYPTSEYSVNFKMPLFDGLANIYRYRASLSFSSAARSDADWSRFKKEQEVRDQFYRALGAQLLEDVAKQNVKTLEDHLSQSKLLKRGGSATNYDVLRVEVQLHEAESDAMDAADQVQLSRQKLSVVVGRSEESQKLEGQMPVPEPKTVAALERGEISESRPDLKAAALRAQAADQMHASNVSWFVPSVAVGGQYLWYNNLNDDLFNKQDLQSAYNLGFFLRWNLFDGGTSLARERESAYRRDQDQEDLRALRLNTPYDFDFWKKRFLSSSARYQSKILDVSSSEESVRLARAEQRAGSRTSTEVLDAELDLFRAKAGVIQAQLNSIEAQSHLELALGRRLAP